MTELLLIFIFALFTVLAVFYGLYRYDLYQLGRILERGDLKYLKRYAPFFKLSGLRRVFSAIDIRVLKKHSSKKSLNSPLRSFFDEYLEPILIVNDEGYIDYSNSIAQDVLFLGVDRTGSPLSHYVRHSDLLAALSTVFEKKIPHSLKINLFLKKENFFSIRFIPFGKNQAILIFTDESYYMNLEKMRSEFVANASHELKTPLATIKGAVETLLSSKNMNDEGQKDFLIMMDRQASRMSMLIDDLLTLSKIELEENILPEENIDVKDILKNVIDDLSLQANEKNIQITFNSLDEDVMCLGDQQQLYQVFENLLSNSLKYAFQNSEIKIDIFKEKAKWSEKNKQIFYHIKIFDQSEGIEEKHLVHLTTRFYRVDKARSSEVGSTGLGLSIVKHILKRHQGELLIESELGTGSCFTVILPVKSL